MQNVFMIPGLMFVNISITGIVVEFLWNALLPELFAFPVIDFFHAIGLVILARALFTEFLQISYEEDRL